MVVSIRPQAPVSTSINSLVKGFILTQRTDCKSPRTIEYYEDIIKLINVCDYDYRNNAQFLGSRNKAIILMLLDTGLRVSELAGIKLEDIESERGWIKVKGKGAKERVVRKRKANSLTRVTKI